MFRLYIEIISRLSLEPSLFMFSFYTCFGLPSLFVIFSLYFLNPRHFFQFHSFTRFAVFLLLLFHLSIYCLALVLSLLKFSFYLLVCCSSFFSFSLHFPKPARYCNVLSVLACFCFRRLCFSYFSSFLSALAF